MPLSQEQLSNALALAREEESTAVAVFMRTVVHYSLGKTSARVLRLIEDRAGRGEVTTSRHACDKLGLEQNHVGNVLMDLFNLGLVSRDLVVNSPGTYYEYEPWY